MSSVVTALPPTTGFLRVSTPTVPAPSPDSPRGAAASEPPLHPRRLRHRGLRIRGAASKSKLLPSPPTPASMGGQPDGTGKPATVPSVGRLRPMIPLMAFGAPEQRLLAS